MPCDNSILTAVFNLSISDLTLKSGSTNVTNVLARIHSDEQFFPIRHYRMPTLWKCYSSCTNKEYPEESVEVWKMGCCKKQNNLIGLRFTQLVDDSLGN